MALPQRAPRPLDQFPGDGDVVAAAQAGNDAARVAVYQTLAPPVAGYLRAQRAVDVEDLVSDIFVQVFTHLPSFEGTWAQFRSWVFTIAHHRLADQRRRLARRPTCDPLPDDLHDGLDRDPVLDRLAVRRVAALLHDLRADQRDVLLLRILADQSIEQTAQILGRSQAAVKGLQRRGLAHLRKRVRQAGPS